MSELRVPAEIRSVPGRGVSAELTHFGICSQRLTICCSDIAAAMSSLSIQQTNSNSLQQQRQADAQDPQYGVDAHADAPLTAPTPTRASVGPHSGMWTPDVGIRFAGVPTAPGHARPANGPPQDSRWDPAKGLKFG